MRNIRKGNSYLVSITSMIVGEPILSVVPSESYIDVGYFIFSVPDIDCVVDE